MRWKLNLSKKGRSKNPSIYIYWSKKIDIKILTGFLTVCGRFIVKNTLTQILMYQICLIYFDQSSIFWQLFNILTRVWAPVKILIKNSVLRWTFSQNQSYGNGSIRIKHFQHNKFWSKFWWNVCGEIWRQKSYQKLDVHFLLQNIDCFFDRVWDP